MKGEIFAIGTELLMGEVTDTNSSYIASQLPPLGISVFRMSQLGDDLNQLAESIKTALERSDYIFTSGGLGPTQDDLTREAVSAAIGEEMTVAPELLKDLERWFQNRGAEMPKRNIKQATLVPSASTIPNNQGTAPGWWVEKNGKVIVCMPGPPGEMKNIWVNQVLPRIKARVKGQVIVTRNIKTADLSEADVAERVSEFFGFENPYLGIYAKHDGIHLRVIARAASQEEARALIKPVEDGIHKIVGEHIWGYDDETPEEAVGYALKAREFTLATMESCTGGLLASNITDIPGSSDYFRGGIVAYNTDIKIANGVSPDVVKKFGVISKETAEAMAQAVSQRLSADVGIGITGVAGPSEQEGMAVGTVFIGIAINGHCRTVSLRLPPRRAVVKYRSVTSALVELRRMLNES